MLPGDAEAVSRLSAQLGYPMPESTVHDRINTVLNQPGHAGFVAESDGKVVGWIHVYVAHIIEAPYSYTEIGGLVVDENMRGKGVGCELVQAVERWSLANGFDDIRVRSASKRTDAHAFYARLGYKFVKTQMRFEKSLNSP
jgi:GNAT superfamily N-acetyltransferase